MKLAGLVALLAMYSPTGVEARFAVACTGSARSYGNASGNAHDSTLPLPEQVFVIDPATNSVTRALKPRQEFEPVCSKDPDRFVSISPGLIQARSETVGSPSWRCELRLDRMSGQGTYSLRGNWPGGRYESFDWNMVCGKSQIPVFGLSKRKF